jgi:hypothetical protein
MYGHELYPGIVYRQVVQVGDIIGVETIGFGQGTFGDVFAMQARLNELIAIPLWNMQTWSIFPPPSNLAIVYERENPLASPDQVNAYLQQIKSPGMAPNVQCFPGLLRLR